MSVAVGDSIVSRAIGGTGVSVSVAGSMLRAVALAGRCRVEVALRVTTASPVDANVSVGVTPSCGTLVAVASTAAKVSEGATTVTGGQHGRRGFSG